MKGLSSYTCAYKGCTYTKRDSLKVTLYSFPVNNPERCKQWIINCGNEILMRNIDNLEIARRKVLCEKHFPANSCYDSKATKKMLLKNAIPMKHDSKSGKYLFQM